MKREGLLSQLIDITPALRTGAAVFPGDAPYRVTQTFAIGPGCPVNVTEVSMSTHCPRVGRVTGLVAVVRKCSPSRCK